MRCRRRRGGDGRGQEVGGDVPQDPTRSRGDAKGVIGARGFVQKQMKTQSDH